MIPIHKQINDNLLSILSLFLNNQKVDVNQEDNDFKIFDLIRNFTNFLFLIGRHFIMQQIMQHQKLSSYI